MSIQTKSKNKTSRIAAPPSEQSGPIIRQHGTWSVGDHAHQGDIILVCIESLPKSAKPRTDRQLAIGTTVGSRHVLEGGACYEADAAEVVRAIKAATKGRVDCDPKYAGPIFTGEAFVRHPQHQDQGFPADTVTAVIYQRNLDAEEREVRAID